jgi:hypothetical protein
MGLFRKKKEEDNPDLDREDALQAVPIINQLVTIDYNAEGQVVLNLPRKRTTMVKLIAKVFRLPPYKEIELDELGTYTVELCNGGNTVEEIIEKFAERFQLNRREAELSMLSYLKTLAKRGIVGFALDEDGGQSRENRSNG